MTSLPWWASILVLGACSTFYTALGGIKAIVWTVRNLIQNRMLHLTRPLLNSPTSKKLMKFNLLKLVEIATICFHTYKLETLAGCFPNRDHCQRTAGSPDPGSGENRRNVERLEDRGRRIQDRVLQLQLRSVRASQLLEPDLRIDHPLGIALPEFTISRSPMPLPRQFEERKAFALP